jgi:hypothetical protein
MKNFKARSHAPMGFSSSSAAKIFIPSAIVKTSAPKNLVLPRPAA